MRRVRISVPALLVVLACLLGATQAGAQQRKLLYPADAGTLSAEMQQIVASVRNPQAPRVPYAKLPTQAKYFVRIAERPWSVRLAPGAKSYTLQNMLGADSTLGTKPLVFVTTPESIAGASLLEMYQDIGYEAEDILRTQNGRRMVAVVFRFPDGYSVSSIRDGALPAADKSIYVPTWANMSSLLSRFTKSQPNALNLDEAACAFVQGFTDLGRVQGSSYFSLREKAGDDWRYRKVLEEKLGCMEHFRGDGRTQNELLDPDGTLGIGLPEFVAPNFKLSELPEVAVIDLGRLAISEDHSE